MNRVQKQLKRLFFGRMTAGELKRFHDECGKNMRLRRGWRRLREFEAALCHTSAGELTSFDIERMEGVILSRSAVEPQEKTEWFLDLLLPIFRNKAGLIAGVMAVLIVLVAVPFLLREPRDFPSIPSSEFRARGGETITDPAIFAFCWDTEADTVRRLLDRSYTSKRMDNSCPVSNSIQFAYSAENVLYDHLYLFGWNSMGKRTWYYPRPDEDGSYQIETGVREKVLGRSVRLHVNHRPGDYAIVALFSDRPLTHAEVEDSLNLAAADDGDPMDWPGLQFDNAKVSEQRIRITLIDEKGGEQ